MAFNLKNKEAVKQLYEKPKKELVYPHLNIIEPNYLQEIDILYLPDDDGFKYLLTIIDVHNSLCDGRALKNMLSETIIRALDDIYDKQMYLQYPKVLQGDNQFTLLKKWCKEHNIILKITEAYRQRQNAHVERLNQQVAYFLWKKQIDNEITSGNVNREWQKYYREIIDYLNHKRLKYLDKDLRRKNVDDENKPPIFDKNNNYMIENGTKVRLMLDKPENLFGKKLQGTFRKTDIRWKVSPIYEIVEQYIYPNNPIMYQIKEVDSGKVIKALYTAEQLQIINQKQL